MIAAALLGSVACVCVSGLVAWRWWLAHSLAAVQAQGEATKAKVRDLDKEWGRLQSFEERLKVLEYRGR